MAYAQFRRPEISSLSLCMDFKFNRLRDVKKVEWSGESPWYCEVQDGLSWFGYCRNGECTALKKLFVVNRGYGIFKLENELGDFCCPVCNQSNYDLRNMGFVNCEWALKGALRQNSNSRIIADGHTFDGKLYTFKELDYKKQVDFLNIFVKKNSEQNIENLILSHPPPSLPSVSSSDEENSYRSKHREDSPEQESERNLYNLQNRPLEVSSLANKVPQ